MIDAGMYDGALGIITAIAAVKALKIKGQLQNFPRPIEVIQDQEYLTVGKSKEKFQYCLWIDKPVMEVLFSKIYVCCIYQVIAFSDEEGVRFQSTFLGSAAVAGKFSENLLSVTDKR